MRTNTLMLLSIVLAAMLCVSAWILVRPGDHGSEKDPCFKNVAGSNVVQLARTSAAKREALMRTDGGWSFNGASIRVDEVEAFLRSLDEANGTRVARSGREVPAYGLRNDAAVRLSLVTVTGTTTCDVGRTDPASGGVYVAPDDSGGVYLMRGTTLGDFVHADWNTWRTSSTSNATGTAPER